MALTPGTHLGPYEIAALIGMGGMGEVYRATDTNLARQVAIKVLPEAVAGDAERLARFDREAKTLAALNHPNIAIIHGLEKSDGVTGLVMELVEGPTLADRMAQGPVPIDEALPIARQIAEALGAAHEHGVVHRDLKPANIKVRVDGTVKVLDFGLAKTFDPGPDPSQMSQSPTVTSPAVTRAGVILGTAAYMAPEQAMGKAADARSDIWGFGLVFYEMLTGQRGFAGETTVEVLSNVLKAEPDWTALPAATPTAVRSLVRRCLQKDPTRRLRDIADARFQIEEVLSEPASGAAIGTHAPMREARQRRVWVAGLLVTVAVAVAATAWSLRQPQVAPDEVRLEVNVPPTTDPTSLAISPDGKTLVFVATSDGQQRLWLRSMGGVSARPLAGTENAKYPFWSPDGRSVGFSADAQLKRVDLDNGSVRVLASGGVEGGTWSRDGTIIFDRGVGVGLFRVSADDGSEPSAITLSAAPFSFDPWSPRFLPDQRHYIFYASGTAPGVYIAQLGAPEVRRLVDAETAVLASTGHLLFVRQGTLFAQAFDLVQLQLSGSPVAVAEGIVTNAAEQSVALSAAASGPIVYRTGPSGGPSQLVWFDRSGKALDTVGGSDLTDILSPALSFDGRRLAFSQRTGGTSDVWLLDLSRAVPSRLTFDPGNDAFPVWSPDGSRVAWGSTRNRKVEIYVKPADGTGTEALLLGAHRGQGVSDWSPDGRFLLYHALTRPTGNNQDIWAVPLGDERKPFPIVETDASDEINAQFSPDGKWIAYQSNETGRYEIFVQPFQGPRRKTRVSNGGGVQVRWRRDGQEVFYLAPGNRLMAVPIRLDLDRISADIGVPTPLFTAHLPGDPQNIVYRHYVVSGDNQRFLVNTLKEVTIPITVVLNWKPKS